MKKRIISFILVSILAMQMISVSAFAETDENVEAVMEVISETDNETTEEVSDVDIAVEEDDEALEVSFENETEDAVDLTEDDAASQQEENNVDEQEASDMAASDTEEKNVEESYTQSVTDEASENLNSEDLDEQGSVEKITLTVTNEAEVDLSDSESENTEESSTEDTDTETDKEDTSESSTDTTEEANTQITMEDDIQGDGSASTTWGSDLMNLTSTKEAAQEAYDKGTITNEIIVAVIDTGVNSGLDVFSGRISECVSFTGEDPYTDANGHGTQVAGIIAQNTPSNVKLMILQALDANKNGTADSIVGAIEYAASHGADIINMSLGFSVNDESLQKEKVRIEDSLKNASAKGIAIITSAGNGNAYGVGQDIAEIGAYPASSSYVITVSAIDDSLSRAAFSNYGDAVDLCAPGDDIYRVDPNSKYQWWSGTSMAAPFISAAYALEMLSDSTLNASGVTTALIAQRQDLGDSGKDVEYGNGYPVLNLSYEKEKESGTLSLTVKTDSARNILSWTARDGISYDIYRKVYGEESFALIDSAQESPYYDTAISKGVRYVYYIEAEDNDYYTDNKSAEKTVTASGNLLTISSTSLSITEGETGQLQLTLSTDELPDYIITWTSSNEDVATVDENGFINAIAYGSTTVKASIQIGDWISTSSTCTVSVMRPDGMCGENLYWSIEETDDDVILKIFGSGEMDSTPQVDDKSKVTKIIIGETVTSIWNTSFSSYSNLKCVEGGKDVESIGYGAFQNCTALEKIEGMDQLLSIGDNVFYNCVKLTSISSTEKLQTVGSKAFYKCYQLSEIDFSSLISVGDYAFQNCTSLTESPFVETLTTVGKSAFSGCSSLAGDVIIPTGLATVGTTAFYGCALTGVTFTEGSETVINSLCSGWTSLKKVVLPEGLTSIGDYAFQNCSVLTDISFPESLTSIGKYAFSGCSSLILTTLPAGIETVGTGAFDSVVFDPLYILESDENIDRYQSLLKSGFIIIKSFYVSETNEYFSTEDGVLFNKDKTTLIAYPNGSTETTYTVPDSVEVIDDYAFYMCTNLQEVVFNDNTRLAEIGNCAFYGMLIEKMDIPVSVEIIGDCAFQNCTDLTEVKFAENSCLKIIGSHAFYATELKEIEIPANVEKIENYAFNLCTQLISVTFEADSHLTTISDGAFKRTAIEEIEIPASVEKIGIEAFSAHANQTFPFLQKLTFEENSQLVSIGKYAFRGTQIEEIEFPASLESIDYSAFYDCSSLKTVTFDENSSLKSIGSAAFSSTALDEFECPDGVTSIGANVFKGTSIQVFRWPSECPYLFSNAFTGCQLAILQIPAIVTIVGTKTNVYTDHFEELTDIYYEGFQKQFDTITIANSKDQDSFDNAILHLIPSGICGDGVTWSAEGISGSEEGLTLIISGTGRMDDFGKVADLSDTPWYDGRDEIKKVVIEDGVTYIGDFAFYMFKNISEVSIPSSVTEYGDNVFRLNSSLEKFDYYKENSDEDTVHVYVEDLVKLIGSDPIETRLEVENSSGTILAEGIDYSVTYIGDTTKEGTVLIRVEFLGDYSEYEPLNIPYIICSAYIGGENIKVLTDLQLSNSNYIYDGTAKKPTATVKSGRWTLKEGTEYSLTWDAGREDAGIYNVTATGEGDYISHATKSFIISKRDISGLTASYSSQNEYTGSAVCPAVTLSGLSTGKNPVNGTDFTVSYDNNVDPGTGIITVTALDGSRNFTGSKSLTFTILEPVVTVAPAETSDVTVTPAGTSETEDTPHPSATQTPSSGGEGSVTPTVTATPANTTTNTTTTTAESTQEATKTSETTKTSSSQEEGSATSTGTSAAAETETSGSIATATSSTQGEDSSSATATATSQPSATQTSDPTDANTPLRSGEDNSTQEEASALEGTDDSDGQDMVTESALDSRIADAGSSGNTGENAATLDDGKTPLSGGSGEENGSDTAAGATVNAESTAVEESQGSGFMLPIAIIVAALAGAVVIFLIVSSRKRKKNG